MAKKQGKTSVFWLSHVRCFFSISSPHGHLSSWHTFLLANVSFILAFLLLMLCYPSFRWLCFLVSIHLYFLVFITFHVLICLSCFLSWCDRNPDQIRKYLQILIVIFCFGASIPTLSLGPDNNPTWPREEPLKKFVFCCLYVWSISNVLKYLFLLCFYTSSKFCLQNGPQEKRSCFTKCKTRMCVLEMVCLERRKHSCSLKHRT